MPNIKEKPQEFELIELLFPDIAKSSIPQNPPLDYSFQARFQSFLNQIPSYLHSSIKEGFFPHFFLGSFSTLLDTRLGVQKIGITSLYFRFDSARTLKVVVEIEKKYMFLSLMKRATKNIHLNNYVYGNLNLLQMN